MLYNYVKQTAYRCNNTLFVFKRVAKIVVCLPWMYGLLVHFLSGILTSGISNGTRCIRYNWPNKTIQVAYGLFTVIIQYFVPLVVLTFAYTRIFTFIRARRRVVSEDGKSNEIKMEESRAETRSAYLQYQTGTNKFVQKKISDEFLIQINIIIMHYCRLCVCVCCVCFIHLLFPINHKLNLYIARQIFR